MSKQPIRGKRAMEILQQGIVLPNGKILKLVDWTILTTDPTYQRPIPESSVQRIAGKDYDEAALGVLQVGQRKGTEIHNLIDGQTRQTALKVRKAKNKSVPTFVVCLITPNTTREQEAKMFVQHNTNKPVTGNARFKARLEYHEKPETTIRRWVHGEGFVLSFNKVGRQSVADTNDTGITGVAWLLKAYNHSMNHLKPALKLLRMAWGNGEADAVPATIRKGEVIHALALFLKGQGDKNTESIAKHFRNCNLDIADQWHYIGQTTGSGFKRAEKLVEWLDDMCGGKRLRKAA